MRTSRDSRVNIDQMELYIGEKKGSVSDLTDESWLNTEEKYVEIVNDRDK